MLIEHGGLLSWVLERRDGPKNKNHAQDCGTLIEAVISVLRSCHGFRISDGVHPFGSYGRLARCAQPPDCCWTVSRHERENRYAVFAHRAPDANRHWLAPDAHAASIKNL
jgi:hypothetical protein